MQAPNPGSPSKMRGAGLMQGLTCFSASAQVSYYHVGYKVDAAHPLENLMHTT
jgi:hypothetical protein